MARYTLAAVFALILTASATKTCPNSCICSTTSDGLHKAVCGNIEELYKYTVSQKHHNINILDLSHNNITKVKHQLDRLTELVALDLSTNRITELHKFLSNGKKIVHLNLANNRIQKLSTSVLPKKISSLDLSNNLLTEVPNEVTNLRQLEHLILHGNPLHCSCENIKIRDTLLKNGVVLDDVACSSTGNSWRELKTKTACSGFTVEDYDDFGMMGDDPAAGLQSEKDASVLEHGEIFKANEPSIENDDDITFFKTTHHTRSVDIDSVDGSGDEPFSNINDSKPTFTKETEYSTDEPSISNDEGSGDEGSGFEFINSAENRSDDSLFGSDEVVTTTAPEILYTDSVKKYLGEVGSEQDEIENISPKSPEVFEGDPNWDETNKDSKIESPMIVSAEETISEKIQAKTPEDIASVKQHDQKPVVQKTGTYVCIGIIIALLVCLIGFAIGKSQMRKRREKRYIRQQKKDIEKAAKEMVDMDTSLLGKPATVALSKKQNGKYELVPTHESNGKKLEHSETQNSAQDDKSSPRDTNQNRPVIANNGIPPAEEKDDTQSISSDELFLPSENARTTSDLSRPKTLNDTLTSSDFLSPAREYVPVYSPDMGRVRIKMTETPKPKTPQLVTRSRSNAGDIIITPSANGTANSSS